MDFYTAETQLIDNFNSLEASYLWPIVHEEQLQTPRIIEPQRKPSFDEIVQHEFEQSTYDNSPLWPAELLKLDCPSLEQQDSESKLESEENESKEIDSQSLSYTPISVSQSETSSDYELSTKSGPNTKPKMSKAKVKKGR